MMMDLLKISNKPNIVAISYQATITEEDIDSSYDWINLAMDSCDSINLYIELLDGFDIGASALIKDLKRSPEFLGKLKQFDRVAIVTDRSWIRSIVQIEEALMTLFSSDIELHVYNENERIQARSWINGETPYSHAPVIKELSTDDPNIAAFEIDGKIGPDDIERSKEIMTQFMTDAPPRLLLARIKNLHGLKLSTLFDRQMIQMKKEARKHIDRYAVVGGPEWLRHIARAMDPFFTCQIRTFELGNEDEAWEWLKEKIPA